MKVLMVGDVVGRAGRYFFMEQTSELKQTRNIDMVVVNGENAAHGKGLTPNIFDELTKGGADVVTTGNHIWDNAKVMEIIDTEPFLLRPANYPEDAPGKGFCIYPVGRKKVGVINMAGRIFMQPPMDDPFRLAEKILNFIEKECDIILVDLHAEATSEKLAFAHYFDGRITAVVGTHTHVQTADEKILPELLQDEVTPENIFAEVLKILDTRALVTEKLKSACAKLGDHGAAARVAQKILEAAAGDNS